MRKYSLASRNAKDAVDLTNYSDIIAKAVTEVMGDADDLVVIIESDCYIVSPTPTQGQAVRIGRQICKSALSQYCVQIPKLFSSIEIKEVNHDQTDQQEHPGGHF